MFNLYDVIEKAQEGHAVETIARRYGLTPEQTQAALDALLPAYAMGLQQVSRTQEGLQQIAAIVGKIDTKRAVEEPASVFSAESIATGQEFVETIFRSTDLSKAVAAQAATWSGLTHPLMQQMMPGVAAMVAAGLGRTGASDPVTQMFTRMGFPGNPFTLPFSGAPAAQRAAASAAEARLADMRGHATTVNRTQGDLVGGLFEAGRTVQEAYLSAIARLMSLAGAGLAPATPAAEPAPVAPAATPDGAATAAPAAKKGPPGGAGGP